MLVIDAVTRLLPGALGMTPRRRMNRLVREAACQAGAQYMDIASLQLSDKHLASDHPLAEATECCWIIRITRGRRSFGVGPCRRS